MIRKAILGGATVFLVVLVVVGLLSARESSSGTEPEAPAPGLAKARKALAGAPAPLAALHAQSSELLDGGAPAFARRLRALRGYPVVVNKWGSWCGPCRAEFPTLQRAAVKHGKQVAFLGVDGQDDQAAARKFLRSYPVAYPSYVDHGLDIAKRLNAVQGFPSTVFYDRRGRVAYIKQGSYAGDAAFEADVRRYAR